MASGDDPALSPARVHAATERALASGALQPMRTDTQLVDDGGVRFVVRAVSSLARKADAAAPRGPAPADPLGDYDPALFVAHLGDTHHVLLNKFPVLPRHLLLVVTRRFEPQDSLLGAADFAALATALDALDGLAFYNGGATAGASQARKHLQLVPLPLGPPGTDDVPMERVLHDAPAPPFPHAFAALPDRAGADARHALYRELLARCGIHAVASDDGERASQPYNLLARRGWMLVVPRTRPECASIPVNALGFAGSLFVRSAQELARVREIGPMQLLRAVTSPGS